MKFHVLTLFPAMFDGPLAEGVVGRAISSGLVSVERHDFREFATDKHGSVDDYPFGGGPGMVLKPEPVFAAMEAIPRSPRSRVLLMSPQGRPLQQADLQRWSSDHDQLVFLCGHYEGVDHRVIEELVDEEISIGDYVLTNGALASAVICDAIIRLLPGALGDERSPQEESFSDPNLLEAPAYTKPAEFRGLRVPDVLLSGHHAEIENWKREQALERTRKNRPDLIEE